MEVGYYMGILDVWAAKVKKPGTMTEAPEYDTPVVMGSSIEVKISPVYREGKMYASNRVVRDVKLISGYEVEADVDQIVPAVRRMLMGRTQDGNKVDIIGGDNRPPEVAIGFALTLDDGSRELWWLYRGTFSELEVSAKTDGEKVEYQTPKVKGVFNRRLHDNRLAMVVNSKEAGAETAVKDWFDKVYKSPAAGVGP